MGTAVVFVVTGATALHDQRDHRLNRKINNAHDPSILIEWLNSKPLKLADLKGKVVIVHFFAFNCINCKHNYPWYRDVQEKYKNSDVVLIGVHTPELTSEYNVESLKKQLQTDLDKANKILAAAAPTRESDKAMNDLCVGLEGWVKMSTKSLAVVTKIFDARVNAAAKKPA